MGLTNQSAEAPRSPSEAEAGTGAANQRAGRGGESERGIPGSPTGWAWQHPFGGGA